MDFVLVWLLYDIAIAIDPIEQNIGNPVDYSG